MKTFEYNNKIYNVGNKGFLLDPNDWDENFAIGMAPKVKIRDGLKDAHWKVIYFIRNTFEKINVCPLIYVACKKNDLGLGELKRLFPTGYLRGACKLAGVTYHDGYFQQFWLEEHIVHHTRMYERKTYHTDVQGFLIDASEWDENFALHKAYEMKMPQYLTERHWKIIYYLRKKWEETTMVPTVYQTCEDNNIDLDILQSLFPDGYHRGAVKIAGLQYR
ncbi:MAG: sulfurtransferase TusE [Candidatus Zixiibacteriota bacterium]|nr:MAG: sulfurtransferase TusE [candidate division Zixibacteria bacterium]HDL04157.1 TusE/DsrC/DsvC family sulfur relay protein [candidate division Zixibacteria bacterium]